MNEVLACVMTMIMPNNTFCLRVSRRWMKRVVSTTSCDDSGGQSPANCGLIKQGQMGTYMFADYASFEPHYADACDDHTDQRFDVEVPAGKLGMVIDTPTAW